MLLNCSEAAEVQAIQPWRISPLHNYAWIGLTFSPQPLSPQHALFITITMPLHCLIQPTASNSPVSTGVLAAMTWAAVCRTASLIQLSGVPGSVRSV